MRQVKIGAGAETISPKRSPLVSAALFRIADDPSGDEACNLDDGHIDARHQRKADFIPLIEI